MFLSYASEDADIAARIADALKAAGVEVWFDREELRGGDAWDQKIRQQIRDCRLFVPIVSAHTEARPEGYFRREWKLAVDRMHDMSERMAFLVPVVIDGTPEAGADVPERFRSLQWTRVPAGVRSDVFVGRIVALLGGETPAATTAGRAIPATSLVPPPRARTRRAPWAIIGIGALGFAVSGAWFVSHRFEGRQPGTANQKSVAVLPFVDMSEKHDQEYFTDGLTEELINRLTQATDLKVIARTSSFQFKGKNDDARTIAALLGVQNLVEGSVRKFDSNIRVTAQLVRASDGTQLWSHTYDRLLRDSLKIQDDVADAVAKELSASLGERDRPTPDMDAAYTLFLQAIAVAHRAEKPEGWGRAVKMLEDVVQQAPDLAIAWAMLARHRSGLFLWEGGSDPKLRDKVRIRATREADVAIRLDPQLPEAHMAKAHVLALLGWDWQAADREMRRALELGSRNVDVVSVAYFIAYDLGRWDEALAHARRATELDPLDWANFERLASVQSTLGRFSDAEASIRVAMKLGPGADELRTILVWVLWDSGRHEEAVAENEHVSDPDDRSANEACLWHLAGKRSEADGVLAELLPRLQTKSPYTIALVYACRAELDNAFSWFDRAARERDPGMANLLELTTDHKMRALVSDPRFKKLLREMGLAE